MQTAIGLEQKELGLVTIPQSTEQSLAQLFPEQKYEERRLKQAKDALGLLGYGLSAIELETVVMEVEFLTETWLDEFERNIFKGLTLQELLHEKEENDEIE